MIRQRRFLSVALAVGLGAVPLLYGQSAVHTVTTTLLPMENGDAIKAEGFEIQTTPKIAATLTFDLGRLPTGPEVPAFSRCTLRIVASEVVANTNRRDTGSKQVLVNGYVPKPKDPSKPEDPSVVALSRITANEDKQNVQPIAEGYGSSLCKAIHDAYVTAGKKFSISLATGTHNGSSIFYSLSKASSGDEFSRLPRLVIEYTSPPQPFLDSLSWNQRQHDSQHTGRNSWKPFEAPSGFTKEQITLPGRIADYPLIYRGNLYLIYNDGVNNQLRCLDFSAKRTLWEANIGREAVERPPVIGPDGLMYVVTKGKIAAYDLNRTGAEVSSFALSGERKLTPGTDMTVGNDGSLFLALQEKSGVNYLLGFTSKLVPFIRSTPYSQLSTITMSTTGDKIFAQTPEGAAILDIANPKERTVLPFVGEDYYNVPVAGPAGGAMVFSTFNNDNRGRIWSYLDPVKKWQIPDTDKPEDNTSPSQPVLGENERIYFFMGGQLHNKPLIVTGKPNHEDPKPAAPAPCGVGSNLVMDGGDNIYFWCKEGILRGYKADTSELFAPISVPGPGQFLRLQLGPDGTIWANGNNDVLYVLKPTYAKTNLTVKPEDIKTHTVYRTTGDLTVAADVTVSSKDKEAPMEVLFEAKGSISFAKGFSVKKNASLICRTGF
jgi:hypothetical protein